MSVSAIIGGFSSYSKLRGSNDDDWVDRVNHLYTVIILVIFAIFISGGQYVGNPIECWCPAHFTGSYVAYTKSYCWVKNTYYIPMDNTIPVEHNNRSSEELTYYQWVPIILLFMAFLFKAPSILWRIFNSGSGLNLEKIVNMTTDTQIGSPDKREETLRHISVYMDRWLETHRQYHWNALIRARERVSKLCCFLCSKRDGTYLTGLYIFVKLVYVVNVICQFFLLNAFMGEWYNMYGMEVLSGLYNDHAWKDSPRFPKVTLCDFDIRQLNNIQRHTVQCVLPINLFNEKIFIFLWFWFVVVAVVTVANFGFWIWRVLFKMNRVRYIKKYLKLLDEVRGEEDKRFAKKFADQYLRDDGIFVLRLIGKNSNDILLSDLVSNLWKIYKSKPMIKKEYADDNNESHA
ncbi:innexin unc-9 [Patella vulgata]|uniref:innexin unc-9 n=1 Tax=Patella vulgata TaxID=6465 RepID=UPI00218057DE|nr:innexin unc-9 [Patella vulgata]XP_050418688.1 innexin unc-9 [Patella vulgata]XP_050418689.1 innexin unc-9 [Patella vulgata]